MPTVNWISRVTSGNLGKAEAHATVRVLETIVDFSKVTLGATDDLSLFTLPRGAIVLAAGIEQVVAGVDATNTLTARVGTVAMSATLTANATVGTVTAQADVSGGAPRILSAAADFNLLSAVAARTTGVVRAFVVVIEGLSPVIPTVADRDELA